MHGSADAPEVLAMLPARHGHFRLESGHHGRLWLDVEALCHRPAPIRALADRLAPALARHRPEAVCGPLIEGAFVALMIASALDLPFTYAAPAPPRDAGLFPVAYRIPGALRPRLTGRRVAIVNDVINAGSAVRGTLADLRSCGAVPVAIGALAVLGDAAARLAADEGVALEALAAARNEIWAPAECPLCRAGEPLLDPERDESAPP